MNKNERRTPEKETLRTWFSILTERFGKRGMIIDRYSVKPVGWLTHTRKTDGLSDL